MFVFTHTPVLSARSWGFFMVSGLLLSGCGNETTNPVNTKQARSTTTLQGPTLPQPTVRAPQELSPHASQLADAVQQSQARLASSRSDVCPKLIEFKLGDTISFRQNETMRNQRCKYFIYPKVGEKIAVSVSNSNMKSEMVQPKYFNFANGTYTVEKSGKHVLQIAFKSYHGNRPAQNYDLMVSSR